jgi:hypothetical protein
MKSRCSRRAGPRELASAPALTLLLCTGQCRSEVVRIAWDDVDRLTASQSAQRDPTAAKWVGKNYEKPNEINVDLFNWRSLRESNPSFKNENLAS